MSLTLLGEIIATVVFTKARAFFYDIANWYLLAEKNDVGIFWLMAHTSVEVNIVMMYRKIYSTVFTWTLKKVKSFTTALIRLVCFFFVSGEIIVTS